MKKIILLIPNFLTMCNLICGCIAIVFAFEHNFQAAFWAIITAAIFDFLDGFSARLLKAFSPLGGQLDSLSDMVSFGLAPSMIMFNFLPPTFPYMNCIAFLLAIGAAMRLAKFNIDKNQSDKFIGLPTPAMALFIASFVLTPYLNNWAIVAIVFFTFAMVSTEEMFALKFKNFSWKNNVEKYVFLALSVCLIAIFGVYTAPSMIILLYMVMSLVVKKAAKR